MFTLKDFGSFIYGSTNAAGVYTAGIGGLLMAGVGTALKITSVLREGKEEKKQAYRAAEMKILQSANLASVGQEKLHDLEVDKGFAGGEFVSNASVTGAAQSGSVLTRKKAIMAAYNRKKELLAKETGMQRSIYEQEASEYRRYGKKTMKAAKKQAWASLIGGGFEFGKELGSYTGWWGRTGA